MAMLVPLAVCAALALHLYPRTQLVRLLSASSPSLTLDSVAPSLLPESHLLVPPRLPPR